MKSTIQGKEAEQVRRTVNVQIDQETHAILRRSAQVRGLTMGELIAESVREYVAQHPVTVTA